jgi:ribonuclease P protein component
LGELFKSGKVLKQFPFKVVYLCSPYDRTPVKIAISIPKKIHKRAVARNLIRRRIREVYRLNKHIIHEVAEQKFSLNVTVIYLSPNIADYAEIEKRFIGILSALAKRIRKDNDISSNNPD